MLAYAANRPVAGKAPSSPPTMLLIVSAHVALIALVMSARMEIRHRPPPQPPLIRVPIEPPPPPNGTSTVRHQQTNTVTRTETQVATRPVEGPQVSGQTIDLGPIALGSGTEGVPVISWPVVEPVHHNARLLTAADQLKPPYPESKILSGEEASLQLRLTISEGGRVTAVDPIGAADRVFVDAARRYLMAHWRYQPATEDGRAIASTVVISLRFQLDG